VEQTDLTKQLNGSGKVLDQLHVVSVGLVGTLLESFDGLEDVDDFTGPGSAWNGSGLWEIEVVLLLEEV